MKTVSLSGSLRASVGTKDAKAVRLSGHVPCVIYGGKEQIFFNAESRAIEKAINSPNVYCYEISVGSNVHKAIIQEAQFHPLTDALIHADFLEVLPNKPVKIGLPIKLFGNSEGVKAGGKLAKGVRKLKVAGSIENLPDAIEVDITALNIGDSIKVKDLTAKNFTFLDAPNVVVARVEMTRAAAEAATAAAAATPAKKAPAKK